MSLCFAKTPQRPNVMHVTCYTTSLYLIDFKCALNFGEGQVHPKKLGTTSVQLESENFVESPCSDTIEAL
jgi:hypothetical protein